MADELRWIIGGAGLALIVLIYLWGKRSQVREQLRQRETEPSAIGDEPVIEDDRTTAGVDPNEYRAGEYGTITPDHHLADKLLVDIEIAPVSRKPGQIPAAAAQDAAPARGGGAKTSLEEELEAALLEASEALFKESEPAVAKEPPAFEPEEPVSAPAPAARRKPEMTIVLTVVAPADRPFRGTSILLAAQELKLRLHRSGVFDFFAEARDHTQPVFRIAHLREPGIFNLDNMGKLVTPGLLVFMQLPGPLPPIQAMDQLLDVARQLSRKLGGTLCDEKRQRLSTAAILKLREEVAEYEVRLERF